MLHEPERAWRHSDVALLVLLALVVAAGLVWLVHPFYEASTSTNDGSMYVLCARSLLAGEGYSYLGEPFTLRPPGMSVLIAPVLALWGFAPHALNLLVSACGGIAVVLLFVLLRPRLGGVLAASVALLLWANPVFQRMGNQVMSDLPGLAAMLAILVLARRVERRGSVAGELVLGAALGLAGLLRTINLLLLPAILLARVLARASERPANAASAAGWTSFIRQRLLPVSLAALLVLLPWSLRNAASASRAPSDQNLSSSYWTGMFHEDAGDPSSPLLSPGAILARVPERGRQVLALVGSRMQREHGTVAEAWIGAVVLALALATLVRKRRASELALLALLSVLLVYFDFRPRLVLPLFVLGLPAALEALLEMLLGRARAARRERHVALASAACVLAVAALDFAPRAEWDEVASLDRGHRRFAAELSERLPPDARLATQVGWHHSVYLGRPVWSLLFAIRRAGGLQGADEVLAARDLDTVFLTPALPQWDVLRAHFLRTPGAVEERLRGGTLIRLRPP